MESLEALLEKGRGLDKKVDEAETQIDTWLSGRTLDDIQQQRSEIQAVQAKMVENHPDWQQNPPDPSALKAAAEDVYTSFKARIDTAEARRDAALEALTAARAKTDQLGIKLKRSRRR